MDPPKAMASTPPSTVASPHDVLLAPAAKVKLPPPVLDAPVASPAVTLKMPPAPDPEPTESFTASFFAVNASQKIHFVCS